MDARSALLPHHEAMMSASAITSAGSTMRLGCPVICQLAEDINTAHPVDQVTYPAVAADQRIRPFLKVDAQGPPVVESTEAVPAPPAMRRPALLPCPPHPIRRRLAGHCGPSPPTGADSAPIREPSGDQRRLSLDVRDRYRKVTVQVENLVDVRVGKTLPLRNWRIAAGQGRRPLLPAFPQTYRDDLKSPPLPPPGKQCGGRKSPKRSLFPMLDLE